MPSRNDPFRSALAPRPGSPVAKALERRPWLTAAVTASAAIASVALIALMTDRCRCIDGVVAAFLVVAILVPIVLLAVAWHLDDAAREVVAREGSLFDCGIGTETVDVDEPGSHPFRETHVRRVLVGDRCRALTILGGLCRRDAATMLALVAWLVSVGAMSTCSRFGVRWCGSSIGAMATYASFLRTATMSYRATHPADACPTVAQLRAEKEIDASVRGLDAWGSPFVIECDGDEIAVTSFGPDKKRGTADDIRVPRK